MRKTYGLLSGLGVCLCPAWIGAEPLNITNKEESAAYFKSLTEGLPEAATARLAMEMMDLACEKNPDCAKLPAWGRLMHIGQLAETDENALAKLLGQIDSSEVEAKVAKIREDFAKKDTVSNEGASTDAPNGADTSENLKGADKLACIRDKVVIKEAKIEKGDFAYAQSYTIENNLPWAISGVRIEYKVVTEGRSVAWKADTLIGNIAGGIEPDETRTLNFHLMDLPREAVEPKLIAVLHDVADAEGRALIDAPFVYKGPQNRSPLACP